MQLFALDRQRKTTNRDVFHVMIGTTTHRLKKEHQNTRG